MTCPGSRMLHSFSVGQVREMNPSGQARTVATRCRECGREFTCRVVRTSGGTSISPAARIPVHKAAP